MRDPNLGSETKSEEGSFSDAPKLRSFYTAWRAAWRLSDAKRPIVVRRQRAKKA